MMMFFLFINYFYHPADHLFGRTFFMFLSSPCLLSPNQELSNKKEMFMNNNQIILSLPRKLFALLLLHHRLAPKRGTKTNCFNEKKYKKNCEYFYFRLMIHEKDDDFIKIHILLRVQTKTTTSTSSYTNPEPLRV